MKQAKDGKNKIELKITGVCHNKRDTERRVSKFISGEEFERCYMERY